MKKIATFLLLCCAINTQAATSITTPTVSGHWTLAGSPYNVYNTITVPGSQTLIIDPGVSVVFQGHYGLIVDGMLYAAGTSSQLINFTIQDTTGFLGDVVTGAGGWQGIQFQPYGGSGADTSLLKYCDISSTKFDSADYFASYVHTLYIERALKVFNCNFHNNTSILGYRIDMLYVSYYSTGPVEFGSCNVYNNYGNNSTIVSVFYTTLIHDCKIYQNQTQSMTLYSALTNLTFKNNDVYENTQSGVVGGAGVLTLQCNATIQGNKIHDNSCQQDASIFSAGGFIDILDNIICNNQHTMGGGCGIIDGGGGLNLTSNSSIPHYQTYYNIRNNIIANNYSPFEAGGIKLYNAGATITNNQIINNGSASHGAIYIIDNDTSNYIIKNNIFYGNTQDGLTDTTSPIVDGFISYGGNIEYDHNWQQRSTAFEINVSGTFTTSGDSTKNIIGSNPGLIAPTPSAGITISALSAKFGLLSTSPCIDKGDTTGIITDSFDYVGMARIYGSKIDIGAYEYSPLTALSSLNTPVAEQPMRVFPNPSRSMIYVSVPEAKGTLTMQDITGRELLQKDVTNAPVSFDVHGYAPGLYLMIWDNGSTSKTVQKIVVE